MRTRARTNPTVATMVAGGATLAVAENAPALESPTPARVAKTTDGDAALMPARAERAGQFRHHHRRGGGRRNSLVGIFGLSNIRDLFAVLDTDANESVTREKIDAYIDVHVASADANGDCSLSLAEFEPLHIARIRPHIVDSFQALDEDGSGATTAEEGNALFGGAIARFERGRDDGLTVQDRHRGCD